MEKYVRLEPNSEEDLLFEIEVAELEEQEQLVSKYRKIAKAGIAQWVEDFKAGRIKISSVEDLERLIKIDLSLQKKDK